VGSDSCVTKSAPSNITWYFVILCCVVRDNSMFRFSVQESCEVSELTGGAHTSERGEEELFLFIACPCELPELSSNFIEF